MQSEILTHNLRGENTRKPERVCKSTVCKDYKFNAQWLARLPDPTLVPNPHNRRGPAMQLWLRADVDALISDHRSEYEAHCMRREQRSKASKSSAATQARELLEWARTVQITIHQLPSDLHAACAAHLMERGRWDVRVTNRRIVAMLRHKHTDYHELLDALYGQIGRWEAYPIVRARINKAVCVAAGIAYTPQISRDAEEAEWLSARWGETA